MIKRLLADEGARKMLTIAKHEFRLLLSDPFPIVLLIAMPLVLIGFLSAGLPAGQGRRFLAWHFYSASLGRRQSE